ncbi:MAG: ABC transporter substrate-binding protein, partial [Acetobacteraceae bacterium]
MIRGLTRRDSLLIGAAALGAASVPIIGAHGQEAGPADVPTADVQPPKLEIEKGATLHVLRPAKFIDPDQVYWDINTKKFIQQTGIPVSVNYISWEDLRPQTAVAANTGAGPDIVVGFSSDPFVYADKLIPMTELAEYLGKKYGGWYDLSVLYGTKWKSNDWISIPIGGGLGPTVYRISWVKEAGYDTIPNDLDGFLTLCKKLQKNGHPSGFTMGHALGDANGNTEWALWSHNGRLTDENGKVALDSKETIDALKYGTEWYKTMIPGTLSWNDSGNNKAYAAGDIGMTFNGVSIYYVLKTSPDPKLRAIAVDTNMQTVPFGLAKKQPQTCTIMNAMVFHHTKYPNAAKEYIRFMMESPQYGPWLSNCIGYWSNSLKAYSQMKFWTEDPKLKPYASGMDTVYYDGYKGPITAASAAVVATYTVVDMFATVATGAASPEAAA